MLSSPCLSQCAECSSPDVTDGSIGDVVAKCILCGKQFLLPRTSSLAEQTPASVIVDVDEQADTPIITLRSGVRRHLLAAIVSVLVNAGVLYLIGLVYFHYADGENHVLNAVFAESTEDEFTILPDFDEGGPQSSEMLLQSVTDVAAITVTEFGTLPTSDDSILDGMGQLGGGTGDGRGGRGVGIFGGVGSAESFAYVVDASGSMSGMRMALVLNELRHSITSLKEHQAFFVVFFNERTFPMMWPKIEKELVKADGLNKERVLEWAFRIEPNEATMPEQALRMALKLKPDIVFFLTDGDIPEGSLRIVKKYRADETSVHTICVGEDAAVPVMQQIAVVGKGEFLMVKESSRFTK